MYDLADIAARLGIGHVVVDSGETARPDPEELDQPLALDMYDQWREMEQNNGKWRFTSPTNTVHAFARALVELDEEGGIQARHERYSENQRLLVDKMSRLHFETLLPRELQSPIITRFLHPQSPEFEFKRFHDSLKKQGFVIYPGKVTGADTFRIGTIGDVHGPDIERLAAAVAGSVYWRI